MRQMQVLLECEREENKRKILALQTSYAAARHTLEQRIGNWQMRFEDALSLLNFNPATEKIKALELENTRLAAELEELKKVMEGGEDELKEREAELEERARRIVELEGLLKV